MCLRAHILTMVHQTPTGKRPTQIDGVRVVSSRYIVVGEVYTEGTFLVRMYTATQCTRCVRLVK